MRLQKIQLSRYGKFTDTEIALPQAAHDFHLIIGPNEAGKSTLRGAIADLLFGFPARAAAMAFVHAQPELRLAAELAEGGQQLAFTRLKAAKNTLRSPSDAVLPEDALAPFLGAADRGFFEKMFGLGHAQLVEGGQSILDASKDVSQLLFQSAAGIAGLGQVKEALLAEADKLWAPRHSGNRAYYAAADRFEAAGKALKTVTLRAKAWSDAREALDAVEAGIAAATQGKASLQAQRIRLERVRRLAPAVQALQALRAELAALTDLSAGGEVLELPADAAALLRTGAAELSVAHSVLEQCEQAVQRLTEQRDAAVYDAELLGLKDEIEALAAFGESVRNHYADLPRRQAELERFLSLAAASAAELGWPQDEAALRARLPAPLLLREVQRLTVAQGRLLETQAATAKAVHAKQAEWAAAAAELTETAAAAAEVPASLRSAIAQAQGYRHGASHEAQLSVAFKAAERKAEAALSALGEWRRALPQLAQMSPPSPERLAALLTKRQALESEGDSAVQRVCEAQQALDDAALQAKHYAEARHIVTGSQVREARGSRDAQWQAIKAGASTVQAGAAALDAAMALADELVDTQLGSATEAAELQSLRQQLERAAAELASRQKAQAGRAAELLAFDQHWRELAAALALPGLALADAQGWLGRREQALAAAEAQADKAELLQQAVADAEAARRVLASELARLGQVDPVEHEDSALPEGRGLVALLVQAEALVTATDSANARRAQLQKQLDAAKAAVHPLQLAQAAADTACQAWDAAWRSALEAAGLAAYVQAAGDAEQALARVDTVRLNLEKATATQQERIDTMKRDLAQFEAMAAELARALRLAELDALQARQAVRVLAPRLREAEAGQARRAAAEEALRAAAAKREQARADEARVHAQLAPLLAAAGVATLAQAAPLVERSDLKRRIQADMAQTRAGITQGSDGFGLDAVVAEVAAGDPVQVAQALSRTEDGLDQVQAELTRLAEERLRAEQALQAMGGGSEAAAAESLRQEALSGMADAAERYVKVTAAAKLLSWAIERYREQNQGPMLARAGAIFSQLTLGQYSKLFVDYDKAALSLSALRTDGRVVEVAGLSEGTRDQLYLALRLAALELHLAKSKALPFVADDLFINFDDERSTAGLEALRELSGHTQVLFLSHHDHLLPRVQQVFGAAVNVVRLQR